MFESQLHKHNIAQYNQLPIQLDIMISVECNAHCEFCVQEATWKPAQTDYDSFIKGLSETFDTFFRLGGRRVVITGGEPTLFMDYVLGALDVMQPYGRLDVKAVYTNGSLLLKHMSDNQDATYASAMKQHGLQDINLSVHHYDNAINNKILRLPDKSSTRDIISHCVDLGLDVRLNLTLQKGGIENFAQFLEYVHFGFSQGVKEIYVRELFKFCFDEPKCNSNRNSIKISRERFVNSESILAQALSLKEFEQIGQLKESTRVKTEIELLHLPSKKRVYISSLEIGTEKKDSIPYLIYMPNGALYRGWLDEKDKINTNILIEMGSK